MASIEKECKWYFPPFIEGLDEQSITSSDEETLKGQSSIEALVRESIQNSIDVSDPESGKPVIVEFKFGSIQNPRESIPAFLEIEERIKGAKEYIVERENGNADLYFDPMLAFLKNHRDSFPYLCVSDYNTIGMDYAPKGRSRFYSFMNNGSSDKNGPGTGGSYGIGKAAYYMFSVIRTILVSSMYKDDTGVNRTVFRGASKLTTHMFRGQKYYNKGHYDIEKDIPVTEVADTPDEFIRKELGTSIYVMGIDDSIEAKQKYYNEIVKSVLRNYWLAIYDKKLEVLVDFEDDSLTSDIINSERLKDLMLTFDEYDIKGEYTTPRPYYEAVSTAVPFNPQAPSQPSVYFDINSDEYGHARFYLIKNDQKHDRFLKMRTPRMVVDFCKVSGKRGFNGVLVCDDKWNELLTHAEPPAHDVWDVKRIREKKTIDSETKQKAENALNEITKWVNECITSYFKEEQDLEMDFYGIKDLLYTDKDFGGNSHHDGNAGSLEEGTPSNGESEFGIATSESLGLDGEEQMKVRPIASVTAVKTTKAKIDPNGKLRGKKRRRRDNPNPNPNPIPGPGTKTPVTPDPEGRKGKYLEIFDVAVRCFIPSGQKDKHLYTMVINSKKKIEKAMVELITGGAINTAEVPVAFSDKGTVDKNRICDIPLEVGNNILHFKFNDNISHSITVATYEFK